MSHRRRHYPTAQYQMNTPQGGVPGQPGAQPGAQPMAQPGAAYPGGVGYQSMGGAPLSNDPNAQMYGNAPANGYPQANPQLDGLSQGFNNLNIAGAPNNAYQQPPQAQYQSQYPPQPYQQQQQPGATYGQSNGPYGAPYENKMEHQTPPLNALYQSDLLRALPPPIADLSYPPPPLIVAPNATVIPNNPNANASSDFIRSTLNAIPSNSSLLKKSKLPLAFVLRPYISLKDEKKPVPIANDTVISRCRRCRMYISPFVQFVENGKRWRCNMCALMNDVPAAFDFDKVNQIENNRYNRPELNYGVVEFIAPKEYMARVPPPIVYVFVLDVTVSSIKSGLLATVATTIMNCLDEIPQKDERARVAFIGVDSSLHFFSIPEDSEDKENSIITVPDLDEPFIPSPESLLVNLKACRENIGKLLENMSSYFARNIQPKFALGPALKSAHKLIENLGGKIIAFASTLPDTGVGKLTVRGCDSNVAMNPKEATALLSANDSFYKSFAIACNKSQVTIEFFLTPQSYIDVATLSNLPRYTAGQTHYYSGWTAGSLEDVTKLSKEVANTITSDISLEAVVRTRCSSGLKLKNYYGNFFNRASDLCSFSTFPRDQSYVFEATIDENIVKPYVYIQSAVLHTTQYGERRLRVITAAIPTTSSISEVFASADQLAITNLFVHKAIEKLMSSTFQGAIELLSKHLLEICSVFKKEVVSGNISGGSPLLLANNLRMLPLLLHSLSKHIAFRSERVQPDHRANALNLLGSMPLPSLIKYIYPTVYSLHDIPDEVGLPDEETSEIKLPTAINASISSFDKYGLYLIDNSQELFLWIGGEAVPDLVNDTFGTPDIFQVPCGNSYLPVLENDFNNRVRNIIAKVRESHDTVVYKNLYIVRGASQTEPLNAIGVNSVASLRAWASHNLLEDKVDRAPSYREFLSATRSQLD